MAQLVLVNHPPITMFSEHHVQQTAAMLQLTQSCILILNPQQTTELLRKPEDPNFEK